jgi:Concanavalin A-like lectin/glucanases superfamily/FecR protein
MTPEEKELINLYLESEKGSFTDTQAVQLNTLLAYNAEAIRYLAQQSQLIHEIRRTLKHQHLQQSILTQVKPLTPSPAAPPARSRAPHWRRWQSWAAAAAVTLTGTSLWWGLSQHQVEMLRGVGTEITQGELIGRSFNVPQGVLELHFRQSSATVVIEAPAKFQVLDAKTLRVDSGRLTAHVEDGKQGLRVITPDANVLDLGTRFAVDVIAGQRSEVHVFEGKVEANARPLLANEALRFRHQSQSAPEALPMRSGSFVQPEELKPMAAAYHSGQRQRAAQAAAALQADPATIAFLDFKPQITEKNSHSPQLQTLASGHNVHGARWVQGRFPGQDALEFLDANDHVRVNLPQRSREVTLMTWVRLDRVPGGAASIFLTDDWQTPGQIHWMMHHQGGMIFAQYGQKFPAKEQTVGYWPRSVLPTPTEWGSWMHLAFVYDAPGKKAHFYANGKRDHSVTLEVDLPAVLGPAQIGNWNVKDWRDVEPVFNRHDRRLSGRMDELAVLTRALNEAEISTYFRQTSPYVGKE